RDQHHSRLHLDQHVPEDVGAFRRRVPRPVGPPDRPRPGPPSPAPVHPLHPLACRRARYNKGGLMFRPAALALLAAATLAAQDTLESQMKSVLQAFSILEHNAADPVASEQTFYQGAIPGLLRKLDPHSVFFDPDQFEQLKKMESSTQKGFGSIVSLLPGRVIVLQTLPGTPSAKSGLAAGDEIVAINGYVIGS